MCPFDFKDEDLIEFLNEASIANLTEEKSKYLTMMIEEVTDCFKKEVEKIVQLEQKEFEEQNDVSPCGYVQTKVKSLLFPTFTVKHKRYRNKEFHSVLIGKHTNRFFMDFIFLMGIMSTLCPTYESLKEFFNFFGSSLSNDMVSNVKKAMDIFNNKKLMKELSK